MTVSAVLNMTRKEIIYCVATFNKDQKNADTVVNSNVKLEATQRFYCFWLDRKRI